MGCAICWAEGGSNDVRQPRLAFPLPVPSPLPHGEGRTSSLMSSVLEVANLRVTFGNDIAAVRGISLTVKRGETHCLVGESGCGKSVTALAVMGLLARSAQRSADVLRFQDVRPDAADRTRHGTAARRQAGDDLPGADDQPEPRLHDRLADGRGAGAPSRRLARARRWTAPPNCSAASASPRRACG